MNEWMTEWMHERKNERKIKLGCGIPIIRPRPPNVYSKYIILPVFLLLVVFRIYAALVIFHPYSDLEAGDNHSGIVAARPGIEPQTSCSASQELNHYTTTAPVFFSGFSQIVVLPARQP